MPTQKVTENPVKKPTKSVEMRRIPTITPGGYRYDPPEPSDEPKKS